MEDFLILSVAIPRPLEGLFSYRISREMAALVEVGGWVRVPFGRGETHAFVVEPPKPWSERPSHVPEDKIRDVIEVGEPARIFRPEILSLCKFAHDYYRSPLGEVLGCAAPPAALGFKSARKQARPIAEPELTAEADRTNFSPTDEQLAAIAFLDGERKRAWAQKSEAKPQAVVTLLHGVTGSGKTEVYIELARRTLAEGRGVLILVPEIALTPQLHGRFEQGLSSSIGLWHSALADGLRRDQLAALISGKLKVVVGARSAVFAPVPDLGLIIIDEEHDQTYKQEDRVRYHARDLAVVRARTSHALLVLGSATPSLETRERVLEGRYTSVRLKNRVQDRPMPTIEIIDLTEATCVEEIQTQLSLKARDEIQATLDRGEQVMVFLNRRGFAQFLICGDCGEVPGCKNCSISLTMHKKRGVLRCHVCDYSEPLPDICSKCQSIDLQAMGAGTESLETQLPQLFNGMRAIRLDRDQITSKGRLEEILEEFRSGRANTLLGTQMLVKGHDFPGVTLVVVLLADSLIKFPDFRASERALQVLTQVAGRAGRADRPGKVLIQAYQVDHPVLKVMQGLETEENFLNLEREMRQGLGYPPFGRLARIRVEHELKDEAHSRAKRIADYLTAQFTETELQVLGPSEAFLERAKGIFRWDILLKAREIQALSRALTVSLKGAQAQKFTILVDVDPYGIN